MQVFGRDQKQHETRMSNIEQGISNDEVEPSLPFPSVFDIPYSIFCGSLLTFCAVCEEVTD
jgi:hypothetical protein